MIAIGTWVDETYNEKETMYDELINYFFCIEAVNQSLQDEIPNDIIGCLIEFLTEYYRYKFIKKERQRNKMESGKQSGIIEMAASDLVEEYKKCNTADIKGQKLNFHTHLLIEDSGWCILQ